MTIFNRFTVLCALISCVFSQTHAHGEKVHQYMIQQAWKVLTDMIPANKMGRQITVKGDFGVTEYPMLSTVTDAAYWEDHDDIVWEHNGIEGSEITTSHFWVADNSDPYHQHSLECLSGTWQNALEKAEVYWHGGHNFKMKGLINFSVYDKEAAVLDAEGMDKMSDYQGMIISYDDLPSMMRDGKYYFVGVTTVTQKDVYFSKPYPVVYSTGWWWLFFVNNIVGRIAHLIGDMSVPAHVRAISHPCDATLWPLPCNGIKGSSYELFMQGGDCDNHPDVFNAQNWTYVDAENQGGLIDVYEKQASDPIKYLLYTTNQITDCYEEHRQHDGNTPDDIFPGNRIYNVADPISGDHYDEMDQIIKSIPTSFSDWNSEMHNMASISFVYAIRAIAGLFYYLEMEGGGLNRVVVENNFDGGMFRLNGVKTYTNVPLTGMLFGWAGGSTHTLLAIDDQVPPDAIKRVFANSWTKNDVPFGTTLQITTDPIIANATYEAMFKELFNVAVTGPSFIDVVGTGTYDITGSDGAQYSGVSSWNGTFLQDSRPITIHALPPGSDWILMKWHSDAGDLKDDLGSSVTDNPLILVPTDNIKNLHAIFKKHLTSSSATALANNTQRKLVRTNDGALHMVYESGGSSWYTHSTDNGVTWDNESLDGDLYTSGIAYRDPQLVFESGGTAVSKVCEALDDNGDGTAKHFIEYNNSLIDLGFSTAQTFHALQVFSATDSKPSSSTTQGSY